MRRWNAIYRFSSTLFGWLFVFELALLKSELDLYVNFRHRPFLSVGVLAKNQEKIWGKEIIDKR